LGFDREVATDGLRKALQQGLLTEDEHGAGGPGACGAVARRTGRADRRPPSRSDHTAAEGQRRLDGREG
jgi:hypothetical protein